MIFIAFEAGRLGNQLFQYCGLRKLDPSACLYIRGMKSLRQYFPKIALAKENIVFNFLIKRIGKSGFYFLSNEIKLISVIEERLNQGQYSFKFTPGIFKTIVYCNTGYFQSESLISKPHAETLELRKESMDEASKVIKSLPASMSDLYFLHIRRGDYEHFPSPQHSAMLPISWYETQIEFIKSKNPQAYFVVTTDDSGYAKSIFGSRSNFYISTHDMGIDLALMSLCTGGGVLSASSFSWWGAYFSRRNNPKALYLAPQYWFGFPFSEWMPEGIQTEWIEYIEVLR